MWYYATRQDGEKYIARLPMYGNYAKQMDKIK